MSDDESPGEREQRILRDIQAELGLSEGQDPEPPPWPWTWRGVTPEGEDRECGEALVASDGTFVIASEGGYGAPDVHPAVRDHLAKAWALQRLPEVLELWQWFRESEGPVSQADALLQFANAMTHLQWAIRELFDQGEVEDGRA